jgi:GNAT superfamily N-acetyltransferase
MLALQAQRKITMKPNLGIVRKATRDDVPRLVALMAEFYAEGGYPLNRHRAAEAFVALLADDRLGHVWFIQANAQDVGHVVVTLCFSMEYGSLIAFVDDLFVQAPFRRAGLATAALAEVRAFCAERAVRALFVGVGADNVAGQAVYRRIGFVNTERQLLALSLANPTHVGG